MSVRSDAVDAEPRTWRGRVDERWLMAHAVGVGRTADEHLDTARGGGIVGHPMFPAAAEWQVLTDVRARPDLGTTKAEAARGVHVGHDIALHGPIRPGPLTITADIAGVEGTTAGALVTVRFIAERTAAPAWTTWMRSLYRGVEVEGPDRPAADAPAAPRTSPPTGPPLAVHAVELDRGAAHVYTECARIWNPIHTDVAYARAAGLDDIILHGTATLAHGVNAAIDALGADAGSVHRLGGEFRAMVPLPSTLEVVVHASDGGELDDSARFEIRTPDGGTAVRNGFVQVTPPRPRPASRG